MGVAAAGPEAGGATLSTISPLSTGRAAEIPLGATRAGESEEEFAAGQRRSGNGAALRQRPPRKRLRLRTAAAQAMARVVGEEARGASRTHFRQPSGGTSPSGASREGSSGTAMSWRQPDRETDEAARFSPVIRSGNQAKPQGRLEPKGPTGAERLRPEPSRKAPLPSPARTQPRKVGAGGDTSPHFCSGALSPPSLGFPGADAALRRAHPLAPGAAAAMFMPHLREARPCRDT